MRSSGNGRLLLLDRRGRSLQPRVLRHHPPEHDSNTFNDANKHTASDCIIPHSLRATSNSERGAGAEASENAIPRIFLLPGMSVSPRDLQKTHIREYVGIQHLMPLTAQSNVENKPPHTPKLPPRTGARALIAVSALMRRSPYGELLHVAQYADTVLRNQGHLPEALYAVPNSSTHSLEVWIVSTAMT